MPWHWHNQSQEWPYLPQHPPAPLTGICSVFHPKHYRIFSDDEVTADLTPREMSLVPLAHSCLLENMI